MASVAPSRHGGRRVAPPPQTLGDTGRRIRAIDARARRRISLPRRRGSRGEEGTGVGKGGGGGEEEEEARKWDRDASGVNDLPRFGQVQVGQDLDG